MSDFESTDEEKTIMQIDEGRWRHLNSFPTCTALNLFVQASVLRILSLACK